MKLVQKILEDNKYSNFIIFNIEDGIFKNVSFFISEISIKGDSLTYNYGILNNTENLVNENNAEQFETEVGKELIKILLEKIKRDTNE